MAIIKEEEEETEPQPQSSKKKIPPPKPRKPKSQPQSQSSPFSFFFYFTLSLSLIILYFLFFSSSLSSQDTKSWFLSLPTSVCHHYNNGRTVKVQPLPNHSPIELFTIQEPSPSPSPSPSTVSENILIVHGFGLSSYSYRHVLHSLASKGVRALAIDLPGNGFSDKSMEVTVEGINGVLGRFWYVYSEIKEKGVFWAFDQMVETGQIPYEEILARMSKRKVSKPIDLGPQEMGKVLGQVIDSLGLAPVHLLLHDSALGFTAPWISQNSHLVRSVTLVDPVSSTSGALPICVLEYPVVREVVLGFSLAFAKIVNMCCSKRIRVADADAQRLLLKGRDGEKAVVAIGKKLNYSFDIAEWGGSENLKTVPMQVLWSSGWSKEWSDEGNRVARALPQANFVTHSGGRWPQEDAPDEIAEKISEFILSLPKSVRKVEEEPIPEHIQKMFDEAKSGDHDHIHHHHHHHDHDHHIDAHVHGAEYMDAYGLGEGHHHGL
ncbi:protein AUXIN RESPONSE 4 [Arachis stenosperma]|uniref:protein AUXIN RESPONSE 4 n=1 Tax=Arachis stenosperma TaxID=217475 RepID=UPI0025AD07FE|nr:protein AUXIN RESPONSE 4 [Arachis stenosperma]